MVVIPYAAFSSPSSRSGIMPPASAE